jgi:hypothetical protein
MKNTSYNYKGYERSAIPIPYIRDRNQRLFQVELHPWVRLRLLISKYVLSDGFI